MAKEAIDSLDQPVEKPKTVDQLLKERFRSFTDRFRKIR